jgi:hypothetical protein
MSTPPSFQDAIAKSTDWIQLWDEGELSDEVLADLVGNLVAHRDGARGFFVAALTGSSPLMDRLPESLLIQFRQLGDGIVDLTARNLAMSTAMSVQHGRDSNQTLLDGSLRVQRRTRELLQNLEPYMVRNRIETMLSGLEGDGEDVDFFQRWGYDDSQKIEIKQILTEFLNKQ